MHTFDSGQCVRKEDGTVVLVFTCEICGYEHTVSHEHHAKTWLSDSEKHWQECEDCKTLFNQKNHTYKKGEVIEKASLEEEGLMKYTCEICQHEYFEKIAKLQASETPNTNDSSMIISYLSAILLSGAGMIVLNQKKRSSRIIKYKRYQIHDAFF